MANRTKEWAAVVGFALLGVGLLVVLFMSDFYDLDAAEGRGQTPGLEEKSPTEGTGPDAGAAKP